MTKFFLRFFTDILYPSKIKKMEIASTIEKIYTHCRKQ